MTILRSSSFAEWFGTPTEAHSTQEGQTVLDELHPRLTERARQWQEIADEMWTRSGVYCGLADRYQEDGWLSPG